MTSFGTFKTLLLAGLASSALAVSTASAQDVPSADAKAEGGVASPAQSTDDTGEIVVTGSRIARTEVSAMPVSVTEFDDVAKLGRNNAYEALQRDPALAPGTGAYSSGQSDSEAGSAYINLRNLGTNRSLTLIDGRRRVSGTASTSAVDINLIPAAMIDRIEVVTGGAAAIYGADAVTGAVNIITKKDIDGLRLNLYRGISQYGDAPETNVSLATGGKFANGRGSFSMGGTYRKTGAVMFPDRDISVKDLEFYANPKNTGPKDGIPDNITVKDYLLLYNSEVPAIWIPNNATFYHYMDGQMTAAHYDTPLGSDEFARGDGTSNPAATRNYNWFAPLRLSEETFSAIARFDYEITDGIKYGARLDYGRSRSGGQLARYREDSRTLFAYPYGGAVARLDNPYMPASVHDLLTSFGLDHANIDRWYTNFPLMETTQDRENLTVIQNLSGKIGHSLNWEAFYQYGRSTDDVTTTNAVLNQPWVNARDVIADPVTGAPVCRDATARAAGCIPYNIFGNDPLTQAQQDQYLTELHGRRQITQQIVGANVNGKLFALPYGDVSFAAGVEHRTESASATPDPLTLSGAVNLNGLVAALPTARVQGSMKVTEFYGELAVPILRDIPFFHRLEVEGAYRYSKYNTIGSTDTWKGGATWSPFDGLTIRGVRSRSVRVPNFGELFAPVSQGFTGSIADPCLVANYHVTETRAANCLASGVATPLVNYSDDVLQISGGNVNLKPETSDSFTAGVVIQPKFLRTLSVSIDYWNIRIQDVITSFSLNQMMNQCVDLPTIDNAFCPYVKRGANGKVTSVSTQLVNASLLKTHGIDVGVKYSLPLGGGRLGFDFKGSYLLEREIQTIPGFDAAIIKYAGGYNDPRFRGSLLTSFSTDHYNMSLDTRFTSSAKYDPNVSDEYYDNNDVPSRLYNDIALSRSFDEGFDVGVGVKNLFDVKPPFVPVLNTGGNGRYDTIGRYFFVTIGAKL